MELCKMCWKVGAEEREIPNDNESADAVMQVFAWSSRESLRQCSREISIEKISAHRIFGAQMWKPYNPRLVRAINDDDPDRRLQFCERYLHKCDERDFQGSIVWSDEITFKHNCTINRHNCVYWANENPNIFEERSPIFQELYGVICHSSSKRLSQVRLTCKYWKSWFHDLMISLRKLKWALLPRRRTSPHFLVKWEIFAYLIIFPFNVYVIEHIQSEMDRTKRKCYGVPASISRFNSSRLLLLRNFKEHGVRQ